MKHGTGRGGAAVPEREGALGIECALPPSFDAGSAAAGPRKRSRGRILAALGIAALIGAAVWRFADANAILDLLARLTGFTRLG